jgi:RNA polymerase sigma-70 factor (ECF subfamily)
VDLARALPAPWTAPFERELDLAGDLAGDARSLVGYGARAVGILRAVAGAWDLDVERACVERAKAGDRHALRLLLERYGPVLFRSVLMPRLTDEARAKDALADTYTRVVTGIARYEWHPAGIYPWLRTIAFHVAIDQLRARKRETPWEADALERELDARDHAGGDLDRDATDVRYLAAQEAGIARAKIEAALAKIHPRYAQAIRLRVLEERPREEVSTTLGATPATFDVILHRAMAALRKVLVVAEGAEGAGAGESGDAAADAPAKAKAAR